MHETICFQHDNIIQQTVRAFRLKIAKKEKEKKNCKTMEK